MSAAASTVIATSQQVASDINKMAEKAKAEAKDKALSEDPSLKQQYTAYENQKADLTKQCKRLAQPS